MEDDGAAGVVFREKCSVFRLECSVFGLECSVFGVECSVFGGRGENLSFLMCSIPEA